MKPSIAKKAARDAILAFVQQEKRIIAQNLSGLKELVRIKPDNLNNHELRAEASYIHDFYNSVENIFKTIVEECGGGLPKGEAWHKKLLLEMYADMPKERKKIISETTYMALDEILRFRHIVRNSYGIFLDRKKTRSVSKLVLSTADSFLAECDDFLVELRR
jgi:hypothetical protein